MTPSDLTKRFRFAVVERGQTFGDTIIAIYLKNDRKCDNLIWQGRRADSRAFLQDEKAKYDQLITSKCGDDTILSRKHNVH